MNLSFNISTNLSPPVTIKYFLFTIAIISFIESQAFSQSKTSFGFGFSGGLSVPTIPDDLSDHWKTGFVFSIDAGYTFYFGHLMYTLQGKYHHTSFPFDETNLDKKYTNVQGSPSTLWSITGGGKVEHETFPLYWRFGFGFFRLIKGNISFTNNGLTEKLKYQSKIGELVDIGIGLKKKLSQRVILFIEGNGYLAEALSEDTTSYAIISAGGLAIQTGIILVL